MLLIRDVNQQLYFAEQSVNNFSIVQVSGNKENTPTRYIYKVKSCQIWAMEISMHDIDDRNQRMKHFGERSEEYSEQSFFILDSNWRVHHLKR